MRKGVLILILSIGFVPVLFAQKLITVDNAVGIALKNNYDILVSRNDADIDKMNNTAGNAGMLPAVAVNGSDNYSVNNSFIKQFSGSEISSSNASTNAINTSVQLNWTVYDGGKMFVTKNKLNEIEALGGLQYRNQVEQTVYDVVVAYFNVVKQQQQLVSINKVILYNQERVTILQTSFNAGSSAKNNLLQAKIDLNVSKENSITQQSIIISSKRNLNQILSLNIDSTAYGVIDSIPLTYKPDKADLINKIYTNNTNILTFQKEIDIARLSVDEFKANRLPKVNFNTSYNFQYTSNSSGTTLLSRYYGPQVGGSISIPIFQGGNLNRLISTSKIQLESAQYNLENSKIQVNTLLQNALTDFENQEHLLAIEKENTDLVKENLEISMQRLRYGQTTALEVRQAQQSYEDSFTRLINFKYNLKVAETRLRQLIAGL
jgi:outer membrane protein TolC